MAEPTRQRTYRNIGLALGCAGALALLTACNIRSLPFVPTAAPPVVATSESPVAVSPSPAALPGETPTPATPAPPLTSTRGMTLTWWTTEWFSPGEDGAGRVIVSQQLAGFETAHPGVVFQVTLKLPYGKGGLLDLLITSARAAPKALPDLVSLDLAELNSAVNAGLVQPLDGLLPADLTSDFFPCAANGGQINGHWYAVPFQIDFEHVLYDVRRLTVAPRTWADFLTNGSNYFLPAAGRGGLVSDAVLAQYLAAGGKWERSGSMVPLNQESLEQTLAFFKEAQARGFIPPQAVEQNNTDAGWELLLSGKVAMTQVRAQRYLAGRSELRNVAYAPMPLRDGRVTTIGQGWGLAVVTGDPKRQAAAMQFIAWLLDATRNSTWARAANSLPSRRSALEQWSQADPYFLFLREQSEACKYRAVGLGYNEASRAIQRALTDVLTGVASPQQAAQRAVEETTP
ncbi:MAG: extracellular solute-binding protein [Anaerolineae bacterium]|nr:extracellular solute-binding protein [Anaerolineae bacterium]